MAKQKKWSWLVWIQEKTTAIVARLSPSYTAKYSSVPPMDTPQDDANVLIIQLLSKEGCVIDDEILLAELEEQNIEYGDNNMFHAYVDNHLQFSIKNLSRFPAFDLSIMQDNINNYDVLNPTLGIEVYLDLNITHNPKVAFSRMVNLVTILISKLDVDACDAQGEIFSEFMLEEYDKKVNSFVNKRM